MHPVQLFELVFIMLLAILVLHWIALRLKLPSAVALLVGGGALAFVPGLPVIELDPGLAGDIDDETLHALERDLDIEEIGALEGRV